MNFPVCFLFLIAVIYFAVIILFTIGWMLLEDPGKSSGPATKVTLIIPAKNEEQNILKCLKDIELQDYPMHLLEVIVVDDGSTDETSRIIADFISSHPGILIRLFQNQNNDLSRAGKKQAIEYAIAHSTGDLIITSDADTHFETTWISAIAIFYEVFRPKMILGPVSFQYENSFFTKIQTLEFLGLMGVTGGSCRIGWPVMSNGANLAFERNAFTAVGGYKDNLRFSSGDDVFLMGRIRKQYGAGSVRFLKSTEAIVWTKAKSSPPEFVQQRLRWVSKNKGMKDARILSVALVTWLFNFSLLGGIIPGFFHPSFFYVPLILLGAKMAMEFPLLFMTARWFGKTRFLKYYPFGQILNIFYVVIIGFLGNFLPYKWKGRKGS
jgi:cellulose synthase/poly-beta-1,6-N-acetylglucosamine synthase-like glycosyltransferase